LLGKTGIQGAWKWKQINHLVGFKYSTVAELMTEFIKASGNKNPIPRKQQSLEIIPSKNL
jgi:hypothetical protein